MDGAEGVERGAERSIGQDGAHKFCRRIEIAAEVSRPLFIILFVGGLAHFCRHAGDAPVIDGVFEGL